MAYTREIINVGTTADDGSGDYLRDALIKANTNFQNLWQVGAVDTNLDLSGTTIASVTANADITLDPNGTGKIVLASNVEPDTTDTKDLGSTTKTWNNVHANTIYADKTVFNAQSSAPSSPVDGTLYYNTSTDQFVGYVDGVWKNLMIGTAGLQSLWETITSDTGTTTANSAADNLTIAGGTGITTAITGDTLTITATGSSVTASSTTTFTNKSGNISQWTNDSNYLTSVPAQSFASLTGTPTTIGGYGITDSVTSNSTHSFTNKSGNISQWTNDSAYLTSSSGWNIAADDSAVKLIRINDDLKIAGGTGITTAISGDVLTITNSSPGSVTATSSTAFTNKTGAISQWTNDSNYLTSVPAQSFASLTGKPTTIAGYGITDGYDNADVDTHLNQSNPTSGYVLSWNGSDYAWVAQSGGSVTASSTTTFTNKSGAISQWTNDSNYVSIHSETNIDPAVDRIMFLDANDSDVIKKDLITDFLYTIAGTGITQSGGQLVTSQEVWTRVDADLGNVQPSSTTSNLAIVGHPDNNRIDTITNGSGTVRIRYKSDEQKVGTSGSPHTTGQVDWDMASADMLNVDFSTNDLVIQLDNIYQGRFHAYAWNRHSGALNVSIIDESSTVILGPTSLDAGQKLLIDITKFTTVVAVNGVVVAA
jgi:hypothetical protein